VPNKDLRDFFELRRGFEGLMEFAEAAIGFMDDQGIAMSARTKRKANGQAGAPLSPDVIRERVTRKYTKRNGRAMDSVPEPTGDNLTVKEAAAILKVSDASVRNFIIAGKLPKPSYEKRVQKNGVTQKVMVVNREAVEQFATTYKPNKNIQAVTRRKRPAGKKKTS
jgi:hypothetical protein